MHNVQNILFLHLTTVHCQVVGLKNAQRCVKGFILNKLFTDQKAIRAQFKETEKRIKQELDAAKLPTTDEYFAKKTERKEKEDNSKLSPHRRQHPTLRMIPKKNDVIYSTTRWLKRAGLSGSFCLLEILF